MMNYDKNCTPAESAEASAKHIKAQGKCCRNGPFLMVTADYFAGRGEFPWLVEDILPASGLGAIYGASGSGKSFLAISLAAAIATGEPWFGHKTTQAPVAYILLEGKSGFGLRTKAWEQEWGAPFPEAVKFIMEKGGSMSLADEDCIQQLASLITECTSEGGLIIIDTLNRSVPSWDENASTDMGKMIAGMSKLQALTGKFVLPIHHSGKDASRGMRGHSSLYAAMDSIIEVQSKSFKLAKSKDGSDDISHRFTLKTVPLGVRESGKPITSCVIEELEGAPASVITQKGPQGKNQKLVLEAFRDLWVKRITECVASGERGLEMEPVLKSLAESLREVDSKHRLSRAKDALTSLVASGFLIQEGSLLMLPSKADKNEEYGNSLM